MRYLGILVGLCVSCQTLAEVDEGKALFMEANCQKCHSTGQKFKPHDRKAQDFSQLRGWVKGCSSTFGASWFPEDYQEVSQWINAKHHKFPVTPPTED